ncbi:L,D-transpeptidase family protein [Algoriphagus sediminis]|uniref:L,D-transpeptidase family protein n=1 Tax=Algoriphagus sediminis TaxID=3057113 RepID=A0ABT7Y8B2_9BACT|nr:L,D-transpeptidase family protein [Algoriphagus sediminis]MDN3202752.1 L,D-transpeptidase family protein [Algoriphagus sediminis]
MSKITSVISVLLFFSTLVSFGQTEVGELVRRKLENNLPGESFRIGSLSLEYNSDIHRFYTEDNFQPVWFSGGKLNTSVREYLKALEEIKYDGLFPEDYHFTQLSLFAQEVNLQEGRMADFELLLTDSFFRLAHDLQEGKVDRSEFTEDWEIQRKVPRYNYSELLREIQEGQNPKIVLDRIDPDFRMYENGKKVIRRLYEFADKAPADWKKLSVRGALKVGQKDKVVPEIRRRLAFWGLEEYDDSKGELFDSTDMKIIMDFQKRNGMNSDGIIGKMTLERLNYSPMDLVDQARVNMERLRWLPDTVKDGPIVLVNIANYQVDFLYDLDTLLTERVIVGKKFHESPIFSADMSYIVFSPYWNIPYSITHNEILPKARKDPGYIAEKNMEIVDRSGKVIPVSAVDWKSKSFPYSLRQKPGETNSLGLVKFIFPNNHSVYLHDTPARYLFEKEERAMSHGCIRVENPDKLAKVLLSEDPEWTDEKIYEAMHQSTEKTVYLKNKIPVVLLYLTFWADSKGQGHFRPDIYERDERLLTALKK